jgi:hypothetical protein
LADSDAAAGKLVEIAKAVEAVQDGRIHIDLINAPCLKPGGTLLNCRAGIERAVTKGWLLRHESGACVRLPLQAPSCSRKNHSRRPPFASRRNWRKPQAVLDHCRRQFLGWLGKCCKGQGAAKHKNYCIHAGAE